MIISNAYTNRDMGSDGGREAILHYLAKITQLLATITEDYKQFSCVKDILPLYDIVNSLCIGLEAVFFHRMCIFKNLSQCNLNLINKMPEIFEVKDISFWHITKLYLSNNNLFPHLTNQFFSECRSEMFDFLIKMDDIKMLENLQNKDVSLESLISSHTLSKIWVRYCVNNIPLMIHFLNFILNDFSIMDEFTNFYHPDAFIRDNYTMKSLYNLVAPCRDLSLPKIPLLNINIYYPSFVSSNIKNMNSKFSSASLIVAGYKPFYNHEKIFNIRNELIENDVQVGEELTEDSFETNPKSTGQAINISKTNQSFFNSSVNQSKFPTLAEIDDPGTKITEELDRLSFYTQWFNKYMLENEQQNKDVKPNDEEITQITINEQNNNEETNILDNTQLKRSITPTFQVEQSFNLPIDTIEKIEPSGTTVMNEVTSNDHNHQLTNNNYQSDVYPEDKIIAQPSLTSLNDLTMNMVKELKVENDHIETVSYSEDNLSIDPSEDLERIFTVYSFDKRLDDIIKMRHKITYHLLKAKLKKNKFLGPPLFTDDELKYFISRFDFIQTEKGLDLQDNKCANSGCRTPIGFELEYRACHFDGNYYCLSCHADESAIIPARIIHNWDFKLYKVCKVHKRLLEFTKNDPIVYFTPKLSEHLQNLLPGFKFLRKSRLALRMFYAKYLRNCSYTMARRFAQHPEILKHVSRNYMALALPFTIPHESSSTLSPSPSKPLLLTNMSNSTLKTSSPTKYAPENANSLTPPDSIHSSSSSRHPTQSISSISTTTNNSQKSKSTAHIPPYSFLEPTDLYSVTELETRFRFDRSRDLYCECLEVIILQARDHILAHCANCCSLRIACTNCHNIEKEISKSINNNNNKNGNFGVCNKKLSTPASFITYNTYLENLRDIHLNGFLHNSGSNTTNDFGSSSFYTQELTTTGPKITNNIKGVKQNYRRSNKKTSSTSWFWKNQSLTDATEFINFMLNPLCTECNNNLTPNAQTVFFEEE